MTHDFYKEYFDFVSIANDGFKCCDGAGACGDAINSQFRGNQIVVKNAIIPWETCVFLCDGLIELRPSKVDPYTLTWESRQSYRAKMSTYQNKIEDCKDPDGSIRKRQAEEHEKWAKEMHEAHKASLTSKSVTKGYAGAFGFLIAAVLCIMFGRWLAGADEIGLLRALFIYFLYFVAFCCGITFFFELHSASKDSELYNEKVREEKNNNNTTSTSLGNEQEKKENNNAGETFSYNSSNANEKTDEQRRKEEVDKWFDMLD